MRQALARYDATDRVMNVAASLEALAIVAAARGGRDRAGRLAGAADALLERTGATIPRVERFDGERTLPGGTAPPESGLDRASWESGRALTREEAVAEALAETESHRN